MEFPRSYLPVRGYSTWEQQAVLRSAKLSDGYCAIVRLAEMVPLCGPPSATSRENQSRHQPFDLWATKFGYKHNRCLLLWEDKTDNQRSDSDESFPHKRDLAMNNLPCQSGKYPAAHLQLKISHQHLPDLLSVLKPSIRYLFASHKETVFSFGFRALNYIASEKNQYEYMLEGFDPKESGWNYVGSTRSATYTNLRAGKYTFRVKGSNNNGVWNEEGKTLTIRIKAPWWKTWIFRIIVFSIIILIIYYAIKTRNIKKISRTMLINIHRN